MSTLDLPFERDARVENAWKRLRAAVYEAVQAIGVKEAAYQLDIAPSLLSDALNERDRKNFQLKWLPTILAIASDAHQLAIMSELADYCGFDLVKRKKLTAEERLERLENALRSKLGKIGETLLEEVGR